MNTPEALAGLARRMADAGWIEHSVVTKEKFQFQYTDYGREQMSRLGGAFHDLKEMTPEELVALFVMTLDLAERAGL